MVRSGLRRCVLAAVAVLLVSGAFALAGCKGTKRVAVKSTTTSASPSVDAATAAAQTEILRRYKAYVVADQAAAATADWQSAELARYLGDPLRSRIKLDFAQMKQHGTVYQGSYISNPKVVEVRLDGTPPRATVEDCVDLANFRLVYVANNSPVPAPSRNPKYVAVLTATLYPVQGWLFDNSSIKEDASC